MKHNSFQSRTSQRLGYTETMPVHSLKTILLCFCFALSLAACQTNKVRGLNKVRAGMDKTDVLDVAGNPSYTRRSHGRDRWFYEVYQSRETREVQFEDGRVVYTGAPSKPGKSALEQDQTNDSSNNQVAEYESAQQKKRDRAMGISRSQNPDEAYAEPNDAYEARFREATYGTPVDMKIEKRKVAPVFTPVE